MNFNPNEIAERMRLAGEEWADQDAAANMLEETRRSVRGKLFLEASGTVAEREAMAESDPAYRLHVTNMVNARQKANIARVKYDTAKAWIELVRSYEATKRAEMR